MPTRVLNIETPGPGLHEVTAKVVAVVRQLLEQAGDDAPAAAAPHLARASERRGNLYHGLCTVFIRHTSASLTIQENADPSARRDLERWLNRLVPEGDALYTHTAEGPDDMPAHIKAILTATSLSIPLVDGALGLGTWQGIYVWEHRRGRHRRELLVHLSS